jgi:hypothetical protein
VQLHGPSYLFQIAGFTLDPREKGSVLYLAMHARIQCSACMLLLSLSSPLVGRPGQSLLTVPGNLLWLDPLGRRTVAVTSRWGRQQHGMVSWSVPSGLQSCVCRFGNACRMKRWKMGLSSVQKKENGSECLTLEERISPKYIRVQAPF